MSKILITGTGRCGTTFLIKLFTFLGFDTGFTKKNFSHYIFTNCNAGMEKQYSVNHYIVKSPSFIDDIEKIIKSNTSIKLVIIPIRDYKLSAESRFTHANKSGGLWNAKTVDEQIGFYHKIMSNYLHHMVQYEINTLFLSFEKMTTDKKYLFDKLKNILDEKSIDFDTYSLVYDEVSETSRPQKIV